MHVTIVIAWVFLFCFALFLIAIAAAERAPINEELDGSGKALPEASPQEAERPALPPAFIPESDREKFLRESYAERRACPEELNGLRVAVRMLIAREKARQASLLDIERICRDVEGA